MTRTTEELLNRTEHAQAMINIFGTEHLIRHLGEDWQEALETHDYSQYERPKTEDKSDD